MTCTITQRELRNDSAAVLREVQAGNTLIVTRNGMPVAELRPIAPRRFVPRTTVAEAFHRAPHIDPERFREDLDRVVDPWADGKEEESMPFVLTVVLANSTVHRNRALAARGESHDRPGPPGITLGDTEPADRLGRLALGIVVCALAALLAAPAPAADVSLSVHSDSNGLTPRTATDDLNCDPGPLTGNVCIKATTANPFAIPDDFLVEQEFPITPEDLAGFGLSNCKFHDVNLAIDATHSHLGDLIIQFDKDGFFADVYDPPVSCDATSLASVFDNDATGAPNTCPPPPALRPDSPLSFPDGFDDVVGTYTLIVEDALPEDAGQVQSWGVALDATCTIQSGQTCVAGPNTLCLNNGRFRVEVDWEQPNGTQGAGTAIELTDDTGYFWFFDRQNVELVVKVLNACAPPFNRYWVFAAGLTNVEVALTVTDTMTGEIVPYFNPLGMPYQPIQDTSAFATCP